MTSKFNDNTPEYLDTYSKMIGLLVHKKSNKPFKSKSVTNTVKAIVIHEQTKRLGFTFHEDDSVVECFRCKI